MINKISPNTHNHSINKKQIAKYAVAGLSGAAIGAGIAYIPREASPVANRAGIKFALAKRLKKPTPILYAIIGTILATAFIALTDYINKTRKKQL